MVFPCAPASFNPGKRETASRFSSLIPALRKIALPYQIAVRLFFAGDFPFLPVGFNVARQANKKPGQRNLAARLKNYFSLSLLLSLFTSYAFIFAALLSPLYLYFGFFIFFALVGNRNITMSS